MGRTMTLALCMCTTVVLAQYVEPPPRDPPKQISTAVDFDDGDLTWNYVGPRATPGANDCLYLETTSSGFFSPHGDLGPRSFADDIHNRLPMIINSFQFAWVSRTSAGNVPITVTVSFIGNDATGNTLGPVWGRVTVTGLHTGAFVTTVTTPSKITTSKDIWMRVQFSTNTASDTGQLIAGDLNNPECGNPGGSHNWFLIYDDLTDMPWNSGWSWFGAYTPNLPTNDPNYTLPGNMRLGIFGKEIQPLQVTVEIKGPNGSGACAPFNRSSHSVLPVRVLDTISLPGATIHRADGVGGTVPSNEGPPGPNTNVSGNDTQLKFNTDQLVAALALGSLADGDQLELCVTGNIDATAPFLGCDCVEMVAPGNAGPNMLTVNSNLPGAWIAMSPPDDQTDTGGYGSFQRTYPLSTSVTLTAEEFYQGQRFVGWKFNAEFLSRDVSTVVTVAGSNANGKTVDALFRRAGDITGDDLVNLNDFARFAVCFGQAWGNNLSGACSNEALASSDLDRNGVIDLRDFAIFAVHFGT